MAATQPAPSTSQTVPLGVGASHLAKRSLQGAGRTSPNAALPRSRKKAKSSKGTCTRAANTVTGRCDQRPKPTAAPFSICAHPRSAGKLNPTSVRGSTTPAPIPPGTSCGRDVRGMRKGLFFLFLRGCEPLRGRGHPCPIQPGSPCTHLRQAFATTQEGWSDEAGTTLRPSRGRGCRAGAFSLGHLHQAWDLLLSWGCGRAEGVCSLRVRHSNAAGRGDRLVALSGQSRWPFPILFSLLTVGIPPGSPRGPHQAPPHNVSTCDRQKHSSLPLSSEQPWGLLLRLAVMYTPVRTGPCLLCKLLSPQGLEQCLEYSRHSVNTYGRHALSFPTYQ